MDVAERAGWTTVDLAAAYLRGGARVLQVRAKSLGSGDLLELAARVSELARPSGALVIVNDRADIARLSGAAGVHVGQDDLAPRAARAIVGKDAVVGLSTHTPQQIDQAVLEPITYLAVGPVFGTSTKETGYTAVGLERVRYAYERAEPHGIDVVAIGGVTLDRVPDLARAGAAAVAVITDLIADGNPEARVRAYLDRLAEAGRV